MKKNTLFIALALLIFGGGLGWIFAPSSGVETDSSDTTLVARSTRSQSSSRSGRGVSGEFRMADIRDAKSEEERMERAISLARSLPLSEAGQWLGEGLFTQRNGFALTLFTKTLRQRWQREDPKGYLVWQMGEGERLSETQMAAFAESDPDFLLAEVMDISDGESRAKALATLASIKPDLVLANLFERGVGELSSDYFTQVFQEIAGSNLAELEARMDDLPQALQLQVQRAIFQQGLKTDFSGTFSQLIDDPNGLDVLMTSSDLIVKNRDFVLDQFASLPPRWQEKLVDSYHLLTTGMSSEEILSKDWSAYGMSNNMVGQIEGRALYSKIGEGDVVAEFQKANVSEAGSKYLLNLLSWYRGGDTIEELMPHLSESDRAYISGKIASESTQTIGNQIWEIEGAADLAAKLTDSDSRIVGGFARLSHSWDAEKKAQFRTDYAALEGDDRHRVTAAFAQEANLDLQAPAVKELLADPQAREVVGWSEQHAVEMASRVGVDLLMRADAEQATAWVGDLPAGDVRTWAMKNLAKNWKNHDPEGAESWVETLPQADQVEVRGYLDR